MSCLSPDGNGRPRMTKEIKAVGVDWGHRRFGRLMRETGIVVERMMKFEVEEGQEIIRGSSPRRGTDSEHTFNIAPNC